MVTLNSKRIETKIEIGASECGITLQKWYPAYVMDLENLGTSEKKISSWTLLAG